MCELSEFLHQSPTILVCNTTVPYRLTRCYGFIIVVNVTELDAMISCVQLIWLPQIVCMCDDSWCFLLITLLCTTPYIYLSACYSDSAWK